MAAVPDEAATTPAAPLASEQVPSQRAPDSQTPDSATSPSAVQQAAPQDGTHPPVSVVLATVDREQLLLRAVLAIATQEYPGAVEVIVVRDGTHTHQACTDLDTQLARALSGVPANVVLRQVPNERTSGLPGGRNTGVLAASHELVAFCDDDDEWLPGKLAAQVPLLTRSPCASLVATGVSIVNGGTRSHRRGPLRPTTLEDLLTRRIMELHPSTFLLRRRDLLGPIGLVDETLPGGYGEDYDLLLRAAAVGPVLSVPRPLVRVNWHGSSYYFSKWQMIHESLAALLDKHPQFADVPRGQARIRGQQAIALAAMGRRREAWGAARATWRLSPREPRAYLAAAFAIGAADVERVQRYLHLRGRGL